MTGPLPAALRSRILRLLQLNWRPDAIAAEVHCNVRTVYRIQENIFLHDSPFAPHRRQTGRPRDITKAAEDSLLGKLSSILFYSILFYSILFCSFNN